MSTIKLNLNQRELTAVSQLIAKGRPLWGILQANEYLEATCPLRLALVSTALQHGSINRQTKIPSDMASAIVAGAKLGEFSSTERQLLKRLDRQQAAPSSFRSRAIPKRFQSYRKRLNHLEALNQNAIKHPSIPTHVATLQPAHRQL